MHVAQPALRRLDYATGQFRRQIEPGPQNYLAEQRHLPLHSAIERQLSAHGRKRRDRRSFSDVAVVNDAAAARPALRPSA